MPNLLSIYYFRFLNVLLSIYPPFPLSNIPPTNLGANKHRLSTSYIGCQPATDILGGYPFRTLIYLSLYLLTFLISLNILYLGCIFERNNTKSIDKVSDLDKSQYKHSNATAPDCSVESVADVIHQHLVDDIPYHVVDKLPLVLLAVLPRQGLVDAIQYLADLDRVYSEHVRPRFGKRGLEEVRQVGEKRSSAAFIESFLQEDKILREYARNIQNMGRRIH